MNEPWLKSNLFYRYVVNKIRLSVMAANYSMGNYKEVVWLIGEGRSGTTWVSHLMNWEKNYRLMFEPFHPGRVQSMKAMSPHHYIRPNDSGHPLFEMASEVFSGRLRNSRVDHANRRLFYGGLLIKDIFANLFAFWVKQHFPQIQITLLLRNPFAVALSKYENRNWFWMTAPEEFLSQEPLYEDYLRPFEEGIRNVGHGYIERQVLIWAIIHYVLFQQFGPGQIHIMFYEDFVKHPKEELIRLSRYLKPNGVHHVTEKAIERLVVLRRFAGKKSRNVERKALISRWKNELSAEQVRHGLNILCSFGLDRLYGDESMPRSNVLEGLLKGSSGAHAGALTERVPTPQGVGG